MDTRFWGPSGWHFLHRIATAPVNNTRAVKEWIDLVEYVLPCKYCRASFHDYMRLQPLTLATVRNPARFGRWMYDIHNRVNAKLRGQGLLTAKDPSWESVSAIYASPAVEFVGWDFLTSIAYSTPSADYVPVPMPDADEIAVESTDLATRNRYNLLTRDERLRMLCRWWTLIPSILPIAAWRRAWISGTSGSGSGSGEKIPLSEGREAVMRWMWRVEEAVCAGLKCPTPHPSLPAMKHEMAVFESDCARAKAGKTCRTRKHRQRRRLLSQRRERARMYHIRDRDI
jgi:hypothetical protein